MVRRGLADEGVLGRRSVEIGRLVDRRLTRMHAADPESYRPGDVAVANRDVYGLGEGEAWTVAGVEDGEVRLQRRGEHRAFRPSGNAARNLSLCESRPLSLRSGDEIVWTRNIRRLKLINGERATVERITRDRVHVRTESGRAIRFAADDDDLRHVDHAWSSTVHRAQGITRNNVIAVLDSASMMSDRAMLYVEMSRARDGFVLLTDDTEQLVSRLEREGQSVSSALEAAGEAPWLQPDLDMKVAEKPLLWPVLADWRAHVERANEMEVPPFHLDGCEALIARMRALAAKEALPGELASVLEEHRPFAGDRARVTGWLSSMLELAGRRERLLTEARASGEAVTDHPGHAAWRTQAVTTWAEGALMSVDRYRYGVHLDRVAGARAQLGAPFREFGRAFRFDRSAASLLSEWRARESGRGKMTPDDLASRIGALAAGAAPGEMPAELLSAADEIAERQRQEEARRQREAEARTRQEAELRLEEEARARDEEARRREEEEARARQEAEARQREEEARQLADRNAGELRAELGALAEERIRLVETAPSPDRLAGLQGWRDRAAPAVAGAIRMAGDPALNADVREALSASAAGIGRALAFDRGAADLDGIREAHLANARAGGVHSFHAPGSEELAESIAALRKTAIRPGEMPALLGTALDEHLAMSAEWRPIVACRDELARLAGNPDPDSEDWRRDARRAAGEAEEIMADERMCRDHGLTGTPLGKEIAGNAAAVNRELRIPDASEALLRDWEAHAADAARQGTHPFHAPGYPELVGRIENHAKEAGRRMPAALAQVLDDHGPLVRSEREATKLADRLDACMKKRDELLERAGDRLSYGQPVTELGRPHRRWRREAGAALKAGRELIGNERHAVHLDALGGRPPVERAVARIERADLLDRLPAWAVRPWETLEDRVRETGRHRFFLPEHESACRSMSVAPNLIRDDAARSFVLDEIQLRDRMTKREKRLQDVAQGLRDRRAEREVLQAGGGPVVEQEGYGRWEGELLPALRGQARPEGGAGHPVVGAEPDAAGRAQGMGTRPERVHQGEDAAGRATGEKPGPRLQYVTETLRRSRPGNRPAEQPTGRYPPSIDQSFLAQPPQVPFDVARRKLLAERLGQQGRQLPGPPVPDHLLHGLQMEEGNRPGHTDQLRSAHLVRAGRHPLGDARDPVVHRALLALFQHQPRRRADLAVPVARQLHRQRASDQVARDRQPRRVRPFPHPLPVQVRAGERMHHRRRCPGAPHSGVSGRRLRSFAPALAARSRK